MRCYASLPSYGIDTLLIPSAYILVKTNVLEIEAIALFQCHDDSLSK